MEFLAKQSAVAGNVVDKSWSGMMLVKLKILGDRKVRMKPNIVNLIRGEGGILHHCHLHNV